MDDMTRLLLTQLAGGDARSSMAEVVTQQLGDDDPLTAMLLQHLATPDEPEPPEDDLEARARDDPELADLLERLYDELEQLRERNATLADALGACGRCFGDDELCPVCHGRGRPGGRQPDPVLFGELVVPALQRRRLAPTGEDLVGDDPVETHT